MRATYRVVALVNLGVGIAELDGDVALELVPEAHSLRGSSSIIVQVSRTHERTNEQFHSLTNLNTRDGLDDGRLSVCYVSDRA